MSGPTEAPAPSVLADADLVLAEDRRSESSWRAIDLTDVLNGTIRDEPPALLHRTDGKALLYLKKLGALWGESESGKGWVASIATVEALREGRKVVWIDFEDSAVGVVSRLVALGLDRSMLRDPDRFSYIRPEVPLTSETELDLRVGLAGADIVFIDAQNEAMAADGLDANSNKDVARWFARIPRMAIDAGAAAVVNDHVAKNPAQRWGPVGGGHKKAALSGASYQVEALQSFGRGSEGLIRLRLGKDRPGHVRGFLGPGRSPIAAEIHLDATDPEAIVYEVRPPVSGETWQPTRLMERISRHLEGLAEPTITRAILDAKLGKREYVQEALRALIEDGYVRRVQGDHKAFLHSSIKPYRDEMT